MLRHYLKTAFRGIRFHPFYSFISILGLSIGLGSCMLIASYWSYENSFDRFHNDSDQIFRLSQVRSQENGGISEYASTFSKVGQELKSSISEVGTTLRVHKTGQNTSIQAGETIIAQEGIIGAEPSFFDLFQFEFLQGSKETWATTPQAVVLTQSVSDRLFGKENAMGKQIIINGAYGSYGENGYQEFKNYTVAGVIQDLPSNTHLDFSVLISLNLFANPDQEFSNWGDQFYTYVKAKSENPPAIAESLSFIQNKHFPDHGISFRAQPLESIHLNSNLINELKANGSKQTLQILAGLAFLILLIAGCNYMNFATARAIQRHKEIGLRKIFWAGKTQLFAQLITEALLVNLIAFGAAVLGIILINPILIEVTGINLLQELMYSSSWFSKIGILALAILFSGLYPGWLVSQSSFKSLSSKSKSQIRIQRPLVIFQFAISIFVIGFTVIIASQVSYMKRTEPGLSLKKTLVLAGPTVENPGLNLASQFSVFKDFLNSNPKISGISSANFIPGKLIRGKADGYVRRINTPESEAKTYSFTQIDAKFISEFGLEVVAGTGVSGDGFEKKQLIINEEAADQLGFSTPEEAIGARINYRVNSTPEIIGVVKNFHQFSLQENYQPIIFEVKSQPELFLYLKYNEGSETQLLSEISIAWSKNFPDNPFNYFYLDDFYNQQYQKDENFFRVFQLFSSLGILVASLGFFGLTYFLATSKVKEIGIRKTLGAGFIDVIRILGKGTLPALLMAGIISLPLVFYFGEGWLENYALRISISWWMLIVPLVLFSGISLSLILIQSIRSFRLNPIISLQEGSNRNLDR